MTKAPLGMTWYTGDTLNLSIGQGYTLTTPLQLTVMMAAVANDGVILRPRLVKWAKSCHGFSQRPIVRLREETWRQVQKGLKAVVDDPQGTGHDLTRSAWIGNLRKNRDCSKRAWQAQSRVVCRIR